MVPKSRACSLKLVRVRRENSSICTHADSGTTTGLEMLRKAEPILMSVCFKIVAEIILLWIQEIVVSDTAGEEVDVMLAACVSQAMQDE